MKLAVYTAIIGDYDNLHDPIFVDKNCDYLCFTNNSNIKSSIWKIINISTLDLSLDNLSNVRKARYIKTHSHTLLRDYDKTIGVDANLIIRNSLLDLIDDSHYKLFKHPFRDCIYDEAIALKSGNIDTLAIDKWLKVIKSNNYPKHNGLVETNLIIRDNSDSVIKLNEHGGKIINSYSYRDQMSLNYLVGKYNYNVVFSDIIIRNSEYVELIKHNGR